MTARALLLLLMGYGCSSNTEAGPAGGADAAIDVPPTACTPGDNSCGPNGYCDAPNCESTGTCRARPSSGSVGSPVCGCTDGITYWSRDWAAHAGQTSVGGTCDGPSIGKHAPAKTCASTADCPGEGATCFHVGCESPSPSDPAVCWSRPTTTTCATEAMPFRAWETCDRASTCLTLCEALRTGKTFGAGDICG